MSPWKWNARKYWLALEYATTPHRRVRVRFALLPPSWPCLIRSVAEAWRYYR